MDPRSEPTGNSARARGRISTHHRMNDAPRTRRLVVSSFNKPSSPEPDWVAYVWSPQPSSHTLKRSAAFCGLPSRSPIWSVRSGLGGVIRCPAFNDTHATATAAFEQARKLEHHSESLAEVDEETPARHSPPTQSTILAAAQAWLMLLSGGC